MLKNHQQGSFLIGSPLYETVFLKKNFKRATHTNFTLFYIVHSKTSINECQNRYQRKIQRYNTG